MIHRGADSAEFRRGVDFGRTATDYGLHRAGFPAPFFTRLETQLSLQPGQKALDVGTGTGTVARGLAGMGLEVCAVDPARSLLDAAIAQDAAAGVTIAYREGRAEALPYADQSFDIVTAGQCWHWFDGDAAAGEAWRVLKPGGHVAVAHFDWLPLPGNVVEATERLILEANPAWPLAGGTGLYPQWPGDLARAGFTELETHSFDISQVYGHDAWRGRIRASAGVRASLDEAATAMFDAKLATLLQGYPNPLSIPHRVWWVTGRRPVS